MSGYILVIGSADPTEKLRKIFADDETKTLSLPGSGSALTYVSNSACTREASIFQGYGIDHQRERMIFAGAESADLPDPLAPVEGSYFTAQFDDRTLRCGADVYGFVPMMWFTAPGITAVSDSYLSLIALRRAYGLPCTPDVETIRGRMWLNSMSLQQLGTETYCEEISYCTPGTSLTIDHHSNEVMERRLNIPAFYSDAFIDHADAVTRSATRMVRTFKTYASTGGLVTLGLSGGTDSRLCLAAALSADIGDSLHVACTNNQTPDYSVACRLSDELAFPLNRPNPHVQGRLVQNDLAAGWAARCMGLYDALYMPKAFRERDRAVFSVGGQGAEVAKGNFGWRRIGDIMMPLESLAQCRRGLEAIGVDPDDRWGSEWHYIAFRNAIHGGRAVLSSDYVARPAAQIPLIGLSRSTFNDLPAPRKNAPSVVLDVLIKLNPQLATRPFDESRKNVSEAYVSERLRRLGGELHATELQPYATVGEAWPATGPLKTQVEIARSEGFTGSLNPASLVPAGERPLDHFDELVPPEIRGRLARVPPASTTRFSAASREAGALGKVLALTTVM